MAKVVTHVLRPNLLEDIKRTIDESHNSDQRAHRVKVYNRLLAYIREAGPNEETLWQKILPDYDVFCATQIKNVYGDPFIPAIWQSEDTKDVELKNFREYFNFACRRSGKSAWLATLIVWYMANVPYTIVQIYAPTTEQLYIIDYIYTNISQNEFLKRKLIRMPYRWHLLKRYCAFTNGSLVDTYSVGMGFTSDTVRGGGGNFIVVEEIGLWKRGDLDAIIRPMKRESYSKKMMFYIGTPTLDYNPDLPAEFERAKLRPYTKTRSFTCWDAVRQGIRTPDQMIEAFDEYGIPCDIVHKSGMCPLYLSDQFEGLPENWECPYGQVCRENDDFVREELIDFPTVSGALFPLSLIKRAFKDNLTLTNTPDDTSSTFIMSADTALLMDYTQILVGELFSHVCEDGVRRPAIRVVYWREVSPEEIKGGDWTPVVEAMKNTYRIFRPRHIFADATSTGQVINRLCTQGGNPIPKTAFVQNESSETKEILGLTWSGQFKDEMYKNLKIQILRGTLEMPYVQPFASKMIEEMTGLESVRVPSGNYSTIRPRKGKKADMISSLAMLAWVLSAKGLVPATTKFALTTGRDTAPVGPTVERIFGIKRGNRTDGSEYVDDNKKSSYMFGMT